MVLPKVIWSRLLELLTFDIWVIDEPHIVSAQNFKFFVWFFDAEAFLQDRLWLAILAGMAGGTENITFRSIANKINCLIEFNNLVSRLLLHFCIFSLLGFNIENNWIATTVCFLGLYKLVWNWGSLTMRPTIRKGLVCGDPICLWRH